MVEKLDDRHLILEEDNNGVVTATIKAYPSPAKYVIQKGKVSYIQEYSGGTTKSERLISDLESFLREFENPKLKELIFQNRIDDIYVGVREHRNLDVLREEFCHLQQDILTKQSEFNNNTVIEVLRKAGFEITKTTKDIITCAIDNYLDINDNLD